MSQGLICRVRTGAMAAKVADRDSHLIPHSLERAERGDHEVTHAIRNHHGVVFQAVIGLPQRGTATNGALRMTRRSSAVLPFG
eukprot:CAMPEP_0174842524 /NCGR_PEP_ID=MMETSP1114-20130205/9968_1 /TAXON_ID=312471 /ORGANISM="Neobodo designis, Strain CCAP 1951/1" /LENGTH=82 /DNA_ID=CAMNT_0016076729 /DNA_START=515 /DNA_END=763 /DNA_ORIENTATION=-